MLERLPVPSLDRSDELISLDIRITTNGIAAGLGNKLDADFEGWSRLRDRRRSECTLLNTVTDSIADGGLHQSH